MVGSVEQTGKLGVFRIRNQEAYKSFKSWCHHSETTIENEVNSFIESKAKHFDDLKFGLNKFIDKDFISKPEFDGTFESKLNWLKTQPKDVVKQICDDSYRIHIISQALLDSENPKNFNMDYVAAWRRYK